MPVRTALPALARALQERGTAVLCAPPGTGKTTLVPLALAGLTGAAADTGATGGTAAGPVAVRRVIVAEPRRIAARAAARRMAWLLGENVGERVGFTVRGERVVGPRTAVEVVTTGVLLQRLQRDPELPGVDAVVLDECHERHLDADTAAAFLLDVRETLRPELQLLAASATTDAEGWAALLGGRGGANATGGSDDAPGSGDMSGPGGTNGPDGISGPGGAGGMAAPVVEAHGVSHPVEVVWAPPERPVRPAHGMRVDPALLSHVASVVRRALREREGDVLCFLPGVGEIARVAGHLGDVAGAEVLQVHGRAPAAVQDAVLAGGDGRRRVVLATSVAESSLTVPGVRIVVDCGLAREPRTDHARGLSALTTVRASKAAARQRAGRAGREAPGTVYRCWSQAEDGRLPRFPSPEIKVADLTAFALQASCWGDPDAGGLALLDAPPGGAMAAAREVLTAIGAVDADGRATDRGVRMARLGLHPRLARALLDGAAEVGARRAAEVVALLSEEPPRAYGDDLAAAWRTARRGGDAYAARWRQEARRLTSAVETAGRAAREEPSGREAAEEVSEERSPEEKTLEESTSEEMSSGEKTFLREGNSAGDDAAAGLVAALAFPERVARARGAGTYLMASGTRAESADGSAGGGSGPQRGHNSHNSHSSSSPRPGSGDGSRLRGAPWLAVAVADRPVTAASARIRLAAVIDEETARRAAGALYSEGEEVHWADGDVVARSVRRLGAIELTARPLSSPPPPSYGTRCWRGCAGRAWACCGGRTPGGRCGSARRSCTGYWASRGPTSRTRPCSRGPASGWRPNCRGPGGAPTWSGWTRARH
ncbi:helicase-related protein [Streptomyces sp. MST-110588]|uniref:helicase-related protein n=1 Tax=Streptomyces sp. MST-110588 TaxID=2833628 RepID=UPI001F5CDF5A|nr:helicase-related protein [Streptomyces sp. MST-110588]